MPEKRGAFGLVSRIEADAVGQPGSRAFRLRALATNGFAYLWIEREQLQALAMLIEQLLTGLPAIQIRASGGEQEHATAPMATFPAEPTVELKVGRLALGYDEARSLYVLLIHDIESDPSADADFTCLASRGQLRHLSEGITPLLNAGRPRCPMCEAPLGTGKHLCPRANGHVRGVES
ncbi:MAG: DUF3090 family protein [Chloroflexi bacterium]|nr:DUF3090 family protein [Chloroflexota bacterium]